MGNENFEYSWRSLMNITEQTFKLLNFASDSENVSFIFIKYAIKVWFCDTCSISLFRVCNANPNEKFRIELLAQCIFSNEFTFIYILLIWIEELKDSKEMRFNNCLNWKNQIAKYYI